jgi:hypothetical protein
MDHHPALEKRKALMDIVSCDMQRVGHFWSDLFGCRFSRSTTRRFEYAPHDGYAAITEVAS